MYQHNREPWKVSLRETIQTRSLCMSASTKKREKNARETLPMMSLKRLAKLAAFLPGIPDKNTLVLGTEPSACDPTFLPRELERDARGRKSDVIGFSQPGYHGAALRPRLKRPRRCPAHCTQCGRQRRRSSCPRPSNDLSHEVQFAGGYEQ